MGRSIIREVESHQSKKLKELTGEIAVLAVVYLFVPTGQVLPAFRKHCRTWFLSQSSLKH